MNTRVKLIRKQLGMTQEQLAQHLGIGKAALSMIETGKAGLSARNRNILVQELNVNPEWLESGKGNMFNAEPDLTAYRLRTDNSLPLPSVTVIVCPARVDAGPIVGSSSPVWARETSAIWVRMEMLSTVVGSVRPSFAVSSSEHPVAAVPSASMAR